MGWQQGRARFPSLLEDSGSSYCELAVSQHVCVKQSRLLLEPRGQPIVIVDAEGGCAEGLEDRCDPLFIFPPAVGRVGLADTAEDAETTGVFLGRPRDTGGRTLELIVGCELGRRQVEVGTAHDLESFAVDGGIHVCPEKREAMQEARSPFVWHNAESALAAIHAGGGVASGDVEGGGSAGGKEAEVAASRDASPGDAKEDEFVCGGLIAAGEGIDSGQLPTSVVPMSAVFKRNDNEETAYLRDYATRARRNARQSYLSTNAISNLHSAASRWFPGIPALAKSPPND